MASPIVGIDHIRVRCNDLDTSVTEISELLGFEPFWRGLLNVDTAEDNKQESSRAAIYETSNLYLLLQESDTTTGLDRLCLQVDSTERMARRLQQLGITYAEAAADPLGDALGHASNRSLYSSDEATRGVSLSFVARESRPARRTSDTSHISGLDHIVINSANAEGTAYMLGAQLGLDMRMDINRPQWSARLMFFRCGDLIIEVFQPLGNEEDSAASDSFYGLSWRVPDADTARERLRQAGRDVSDVRNGRKPGTRVFTSRERNAGVPTLLIEPPHH